MQRCPACSRHVWETERRCPFCAAPLRVVIAGAPLVISALVGLTMIACVGDDMSGETTAGTSESATSSSTGTDSASSTSEATTSTATATATEGTASSSSSTSTSTSTGSESTSSTSSTSSTTTDATTTTTTTSSTTNDTSSTTTSPDCTLPGEQLCEGVCVNTNDDAKNCGKCGLVCEEDAFCIDGECMVFLPPYGAPLPEPLWV